MDCLNRELVAQIFAPLRATFSPPRPDGGIILSLLDSSSAIAFSRVLSMSQLSNATAFTQSMEDIRLELAMRSGSIPADLRKSLKEQARQLSYHTV